VLSVIIKALDKPVAYTLASKYWKYCTKFFLMAQGTYLALSG